MNYYVVVEGVGEKAVYKNWIPLINPNLNYVESFSEVTDNTFIIISGGGYPNYFNLIRAGIIDVNETRLFQKLVISIDAEEMTVEEKENEIRDYINQFVCIATIEIIVQNYCLESWGLGNRAIPRRNTTHEELRLYYRFFNVLSNDPELMPSIAPENLTRAQFAYKYLHKIINDRNPRLTYFKSNPFVLTNNGYFEQLHSRLVDTNHIRSFNSLLNAFH